MTFQENFDQLIKELEDISPTTGSMKYCYLFNGTFGDFVSAVENGNIEVAKELHSKLYPEWVVWRKLFSLAKKYQKSGGKVGLESSAYIHYMGVKGGAMTLLNHSSSGISAKYKFDATNLAAGVLKHERLFAHWEQRIKKHLLHKQVR